MCAKIGNAKGSSLPWPRPGHRLSRALLSFPSPGLLAFGRMRKYPFGGTPATQTHCDTCLLVAPRQMEFKAGSLESKDWEVAGSCLSWDYGVMFPEGFSCFPQGGAGTGC